MEKSCLLILLLLNFLLLTVHNTSVLQDNCIHNETPKKFGILTTTYIRSGSTKMLNRYLKSYAESQCDAYDNIYIIWNNSESPQQMGVLETKDQWKKNVYFMQTVENSLDFKYIIPPWAEQKIFFSMDDDFEISCETLKKGFKAWQQSSYGDVGPLTALYGRSFIFQPDTQSFTYIDQVKLNKKWNYYHFGLTGISFISRHFMQLYYSDITQIKEMRKHVVQKFNCQDLLLNFIVSYLYPQLIPKFIQLPFQSLGFKGVSSTKKHTQYRAQCITKFSDIFGYNPVRYVQAKPDPQLMSKKTDFQEGCLVSLKQQHFKKNFISDRAYFLYIKRITGMDNDFIRDENMRLIEAKQDILNFIERRKEQISQKEILSKKIRSEDDKLNLVFPNERKMQGDDEMMMHYGSQEQIEKFDSLFSEMVEEKQQDIQGDEQNDFN